MALYSKTLGEGVVRDTLLLEDGSPDAAAKFTEGASLVVACDTQAEIDRYWTQLTKGGGKPGRCGWLTDRFGVSWQIIPRELGNWMSNPRTAQRVGARLQQMTKLIIDELRPPGKPWNSALLGLRSPEPG